MHNSLYELFYKLLEKTGNGFIQLITETIEKLLQSNVDVATSFFNYVNTKISNENAIELCDLLLSLENENIPDNVYQKWLKILNQAVADDEDMQEYYLRFMEEIAAGSVFLERYGSVSNFIDQKFKEMMKSLNNSYQFSEAPVRRIL